MSSKIVSADDFSSTILFYIDILNDILASAIDMIVIRVCGKVNAYAT